MSYMAAKALIGRFIKKHDRFPETGDFLELKDLFNATFKQTPYECDFEQTMTEVYARMANNATFEKLTGKEIHHEFIRRSLGIYEGIFKLTVEAILGTDEFEIEVRDSLTDFTFRQKFECPPHKYPGRPIDAFVDAIFGFYREYRGKRYLEITYGACVDTNYKVD